jgi:hypothetical protein
MGRRAKLLIRVWEFKDAPVYFRRLSTNGGDEDWIVVVPPGFFQDGITPEWIRKMDSCGEPQIIQMANGYTVYIGSHA